MDTPKFESLAKDVRVKLKNHGNSKKIRDMLISYVGFQTPSDLSLFINSKELVHWAVFFEDIESVKYFLSIPGVDINKPFEVTVGNISFFDTCLHISSRNGNIEISKLLISNGADMLQFNRFKKCPVDVATSKKMVELLNEELENLKEELVQKMTKYFRRRGKNRLNEINFGVLADIHFGKLLFRKMSVYKNIRHYNKSTFKCQVAMETFRRLGLDFVVHLGDMVDFSNLENVEENLQVICDSLQTPKSKFPVFYTLGNHDKYHMKIPRYLEIIKFQNPQNIGVENPEFSNFSVGKERDALYYSFDFRKTRFIVLDSMDISCFSKNQEKAELAYDILRSRNTNNDPNSPLYLNKQNEDFLKEFSVLNVGCDRDFYNERFVYFTGGIGKIQLNWFQSVIETSNLGIHKIDNIVIFSHLGFLPGFSDLCSSKAVCWNYEDIYSRLCEIRKNKKNDINISVLFGHDHKGGYIGKVIDSFGIIHMCMKGMIVHPVEESMCVCNILKKEEDSENEIQGEKEEEDFEFISSTRFKKRRF